MKTDSDDTTGSEASQGKFAKWGKARKKGPVLYVIVYGCLGWGLLTGVAFSIVFPLVMPSGPTFGQVAPMAIPAFAFGGILWGTVMWLRSEHQYQRSRDSARPRRRGSGGSGSDLRN